MDARRQKIINTHSTESWALFLEARNKGKIMLREQETRLTLPSMH
jgi:hypothetical protein